MFNGIYRRATSSLIVALFLLIAFFAGAHGALAQGTVFTYQGKLTESDSAVHWV